MASHAMKILRRACAQNLIASSRLGYTLTEAETEAARRRGRRAAAAGHYARDLRSIPVTLPKLSFLDPNRRLDWEKGASP